MISQFSPLVLVVLLVLWGSSRIRQRARVQYPPGPKPHPLWTNLFDFPYEKPWLVYNSWKKEYGNIVHLNLMGKHVIILNSLKSCMDLLDKRSVKYSDRPRLVMICELMGWDYNMAFLHYSPVWRAHRRIFHQFFNERATDEYRGAQELHVHTFLKRLLHSPEGLQDHIRLLFAEAIMDVVYGISVNSLDDIYVKISEESLQGAAEAGNPGTFLVDTIPALKYVPSWFPGAGFKRKAAAWKIPTRGLRDLPFANVKEQLRKGIAKPSILSAMLSRVEGENSVIDDGSGMSMNMEQVAAGAAAAAYAAGSDTTLSSIKMFFLVMAKYPDIQRTAQAELDDVVGNGVLPSYADLNSLPYIHAVMNEVLRWHTVLPLSVARTSTEDDFYNGYYIPKGALIFPNSWSILHDPDTYPEPDIFNPSRWLITNSEGKKVINKAVPGPDIATFGFGRRICPGRHFATTMLFTVISNTLACYNISSVTGKPEDLTTETTSGLLSYPLSYEVSVEPRSSKVTTFVGELGKHE